MKQKDHLFFNDPFEVFLDYHRSYLWDFLEGVRKWNGFPETVDMRFFNDNLISEGWAALVYYNKKRGILCLDGARSGVDWYYRSTDFTSANTVLPTVHRRISYIDDVHENGCCVCYNTHDYRAPKSMVQLVENYAYKLAQADVSTVVSLENSRATLIPAVSDKESAVRVTEVLKDIYAGRPATIAYKNSFSNQDFQIVPIKAKDNLITAELTDTKRQIMSEFLCRLGINVVATDKKERLLQSEATSNGQELKLNAKIFLEPCELFCEEVNRTFGLSTSVEIDFENVENFLGGVDNGESERDPESDPGADARSDVRE